MIRVNRTIEGFEKDAFAHRRFARIDLPIPKVLHIGEIEDRYYCITDKLAGATLQGLTPEKLVPLLAPTARIIEAIAQSDVEGISGFGPFGAEGVGRNTSWREFLTSIADCDWGAIKARVDMARVARFLDKLDVLADGCPEMRRLVHGDFGSNNVLTDGLRITGVIDWSEAMIGDPVYDIANIFYWRTWLDRMERQACYFEEGPTSLDNLLCYQLRIGLGEIYQNAVEDNSEAVERATSRCTELILHGSYRG